MTVLDEMPPSKQKYPDPPVRQPSLPRRFLEIGQEVGQELLPVRGPSKVLSAMAVLGVLSAAVHFGVWVVDGTSWSGPVSWRKPIVFALSMGLLGWTIGWLLDRLPHRRGAWVIALNFLVFGIVEVGLITAQTWRGEASHFNTVDGGTNALIFALMGASVVFISLSIVAVAVWSLIERPSDTATRLAAWWGFALVITGLGLGQWLISLGNAYVDQFDAVPTTVVSGEAGVAKFPHAIALHGVQLFMVAAAMISKARISKQGARRFMTLIGTSYTGLLVFVTLQTLAGRAPSQFSVGATIGLAASATLLGISFALLARSLLAPSEARRVDLSAVDAVTLGR